VNVEKEGKFIFPKNNNNNNTTKIATLVVASDILYLYNMQRDPGVSYVVWSLHYNRPISESSFF